MYRRLHRFNEEHNGLDPLQSGFQENQFIDQSGFQENQFIDDALVSLKDAARNTLNNKRQFRRILRSFIKRFEFHLLQLLKKLLKKMKV